MPEDSIASLQEELAASSLDVESIDSDRSGWIGLEELEWAFSQGWGADEDGPVPASEASSAMHFNVFDQDGRLSLQELCLRLVCRRP